MEETEVGKIQRNTGLDVLRIIAMLSVLTGHCIVHDTKFRECLMNNKMAGMDWILLGIYIFVILGVNLFFLISGYFFRGGADPLKTQRGYLKRKALTLIICTYAIAGIDGVLRYFFNIGTFSRKDLLYPFGRYWFLGSYLIVILFAPIINLITEYMTEQIFEYFCILYLLIWGIWGTAFDTGYLFMSNGYSVFHAMALFIIGAGVRKFGDKYFLIKKYLICLMIGVFVFENIMAYFFISRGILGGGAFVYRFFGYNSIFCVFLSVSLLLLFSHIKKEEDRKGQVISRIASASLFVYLLDSSETGRTARKYMVASGNIFLIIGYFILVFAIALLLKKISNNVQNRITQYVSRKFK